MRDYYYKQLKDTVKTSIKESEEVMAANELLKKFNWKFIHPYIQGGIIKHINELEEKNVLTENKVANLFIADFYNLDLTLSFIDGYFNRSKNIEPFNYFIEQSLILCFQRDYIGAINILIPSIEGILSNYLTEFKKLELSNKRFDKIRKAIYHLKHDVIVKYEASLKSYTDINGKDISFTPQQIKHLVSQERKYIENWYSIIESFFKDSLFANTDSITNDDSLNRHSILHLLKKEKYYSLKNYIRLFNSLKFLVWVFLRLEGQSILNHIETEIFIKKRLQYEAIIGKSNELITHKQVILSGYELHDSIEYNHTINYSKLSDGLGLKSKLILKIRRKLDEIKK